MKLQDVQQDLARFEEVCLPVLKTGRPIDTFTNEMVHKVTGEVIKEEETGFHMAVQYQVLIDLVRRLGGEAVNKLTDDGEDIDVGLYRVADKLLEHGIPKRLLPVLLEQAPAELLESARQDYAMQLGRACGEGLH